MSVALHMKKKTENNDSNRILESFQSGLREGFQKILDEPIPEDLAERLDQLATEESPKPSVDKTEPVCSPD